jgi:GWxTD domain-containing protein
MDVASFRYDDEKSFVELYYAFPRSAVTMQRVSGVTSGSVLLRTTIAAAETEVEVASKTWRTPVVMMDTGAVRDKILVGKVHFVLAPGKYKLVTIGQDETNASIRDTVSIPYTVPQMSGRNAHFSDIELCSSIQKSNADTANIFYKNTLEVIPNPAIIYGKSLPTVLYYSELYNAQLDPFKIRSEIVSSYGRTMTSRMLQRSGALASRVEVGMLPIGSFPSGVYTLILSYGDTSGAMQFSQSKMFYVYNPDIPFDTALAKSVADKIAQEFATLSEDELDEQFAVATYVTTKEERSLWDELKGAESKRKFLTRFWLDRDPDPLTPGNEFYQQYQDRVLYCNDHFRSPYRKGWKSDRGRVYIKYGQPDNIERHASDSDRKPYEVWNYDNLQSGAQFIFIDRGGFNNYDLVHSTMRDEVSNPNWEALLRTN